MPTFASSPSTEHPLPAVLSLIGNTPLVEITRLDTGVCRLFVKLENQNPTGSIKDRVALAMIEAAERDGRLQPGGTVNHLITGRMPDGSRDCQPSCRRRVAVTQRGVVTPENQRGSIPKAHNPSQKQHP